MAYTRGAFVNAIEEHVGCALLEFYKVKIATRNRHAGGASDRIWRIRDRLECGLVVTLLHDVRGFSDRRRAIREAIAEMKAVDGTFRRGAERMISLGSKVRKPRARVSGKDTAEFWELFDAAVEVAFQMTDSG